MISKALFAGGTGRHKHLVACLALDALDLVFIPQGRQKPASGLAGKVLIGQGQLTFDYKTICLRIWYLMIISSIPLESSMSSKYLISVMAPMRLSFHTGRTRAPLLTLVEIVGLQFVPEGFVAFAPVQKKMGGDIGGFPGFAGKRVRAGVIGDIRMEITPLRSHFHPLVAPAPRIRRRLPAAEAGAVRSPGICWPGFSFP